MLEDAKKFLLGLISPEDWDAAGWKATGFAVPVGSPYPPFLMLVFAHEQPAKSLFAGLRSWVGAEDEEELIRVSMVEGEFHGNPHSYAVKIGAEVENVMKHFQAELLDSEPILATSRVNRMNPPGPSENLALFKKQFEKVGSYYLMPGIVRGSSPSPISDLRILKRAIHFRRKEDIGSDGMDREVLL